MPFRPSSECSAALNCFLDKFSEFKQIFQDDIEDQETPLPFLPVLEKIGHHLLRNDLPFDNPLHPIQRFGHLQDGYENTNRLAQQLLQDFNTSTHRPVLISLFLSGGIYRPFLDDLMTAFWEYADVCYGVVPN